MPTTNPVPSSSPADLLFNAQKLDEIVNSSADDYVDRFGVRRFTLAGVLRLSGDLSSLVLLDSEGRGTAPRFIATATDDSGTPDAAFRVSRALPSLTINGGHGFRDDSVISGGVASSGYAAFDAANTLSAAGFDHIVGFQSRPVVTGNPTHVYGLTHRLTADVGADVVNDYGFYASPYSGAGTVRNVYGFYIPFLRAGAEGTFTGYIAQQGAPFFCGAPMHVNNLLKIGTAALTIGGQTTLAYPQVGYNFDPTTGTYIGADVAVSAQFGATGLQIRTAAAGAAGAACTLTDAVRFGLDRAVYMSNVSGTPAAPSSGGVLFVESGALKYRGSSGTITTIAAA